jgi:signal transduction histidine kinase
VARRHALNRVQASLTSDQVISEYRALRASVLRLISVQDDAPNYSIADITRFNEAVDEALAVSAAFHGERIGRARDMFIAVLSHDLRDPLSAIKMCRITCSR